MGEVFIRRQTRGKANRIIVNFPYRPHLITKIKKVNGRRWNPSFKYWTVPLDLETCRQLKKVFGDELVVEDDLRQWAKREARLANRLERISMADHAELKRLPRVLPELYRAIHIGPLGKGKSEAELEKMFAEREPSYQTADVAFMATSRAPLNVLEPGLGKTPETIASVFEAGMDNGPQLVIAPVSSLETVWGDELRQWQPHRVLVGEGKAKDKIKVVEEAARLYEAGEPFWLVVNAAMFRYRSEWTPCEDHENAKVKERRKCSDCVEEEFLAYPELEDIPWRTIIVDEFHKASIGSPTTKTGRALRELQAEKIIGLSGTPFGGKPLNLFNVLQFMHPNIFTSKWRWVDQWLEVEENPFGKKVGGLRDDVEDDLFKSLAPYLLRRKKSEVLPWLPPKDRTIRWVRMEGRQLRQYQQMEDDAEVLIRTRRLSVTGILDEYSRLKMFAGSYCTLTDGGLLIPTEDSCKLPLLQEILSQRGITAKEPEGEEQVVIFSQFEKMVSMIHRHLNGLGIHAEKITGKVTGKKRADVQRRFQGNDPLRVLVMTTTAGGVAITLDRASTVIIMDETYNPDDQTQAEDRCHRASRIHQVSVIRILTKGTIEEDINVMNMEKENINDLVLDVRRKRAQDAKAG